VLGHRDGGGEMTLVGQCGGVLTVWAGVLGLRGGGGFNLGRGKVGDLLERGFVI